jgi:hypothetical protein
MRNYLGLACLLAAATGLSACNKSYSAYALTSTGTIIGFNTKSPSSITSEETITGLNSGASLVQMDYLPSTGALYGVSSDYYVYTLDPSTGVATAVSTSAFTSTTDAETNMTMAIDPVTEDMRIVSTQSSQLYNLLVSPTTGDVVTTDNDVAFNSSDVSSGVSPVLIALAYNNHYSGASNSTLYALEQNTHSLVYIGDQNATTAASADGGELYTVGGVSDNTGITFSGSGGMSIEVAKGTAYAALASGGGAILYTIDLGSGAASEVGEIDTGDRTIDALVIVPD